jgi:hypothetical protein
MGLFLTLLSCIIDDDDDDSLYFFLQLIPAFFLNASIVVDVPARTHIQSRACQVDNLDEFRVGDWRSLGNECPIEKK